MNWNKLALGLQGFGAGVQGQGQQFLQRLDDNRKNALIQDTLAIREHLRADQPKRAEALLSNRVDQIRRLGGDPTESMDLLKQIQSGDFRGALNEVETVTSFLQKTGRIPADAAPDRITTSPGQTVWERGADGEYNALVTGNRDPKTTVSDGYAITTGPDGTATAKPIRGMEAYRQSRNEAEAVKAQLEEMRLLNEQAKLAKTTAEEERTRQQIEEKRQQIAETTAQSLSTIENSLDTVQTLMKHPGLEDAAGWQSTFPTFIGGSDAADFEGLLEKLQSQLFMQQIQKMRGMGSLSDAEGKKVASSVASLDLKMSDKTFRRELRKINDILIDAQARTLKRYGKPQTQKSEVVTVDY